MKTANLTLTKSLLALACTVALSSGVAAQTASEKPPVQKHGDMDHSQMDHSDMNHSKMHHAEQAVDHSKMNHSDMDHSQMDHSKMDHSQMNHSEMNHTEQAMDHSSMDHSSMNHADMQMQGGKAPANARDPHAYSNGYTLTDGPYGMADSRHLKHGVEHPQWSVLGDRLEYNADSDATELELQAWYGT
ncbi:MAG TPA: copper resistance protein CopB, partial [Rheinheimera sp.]